MKNGKAKVVLGGPEKLRLEDMVAIMEALREKGATVSACRTDIFFHFEQFEAGCKGSTHLILFVDDEGSHLERKMLAAAKLARVERTAIVCLGTCAALKRHEKLIDQRRVHLIVRRSFRDGSQLGSAVPNHLVAEDLVKSAREIARAVLIGWR